MGKKTKIRSKKMQAAGRKDLTPSPARAKRVKGGGAPSGGTSNFGAAAIFPGVGSSVGSILPGVISSK